MRLARISLERDGENFSQNHHQKSFCFSLKGTELRFIIVVANFFVTAYGINITLPRLKVSFETLE